jgi:hypothetical protein
MLDDEFYHTPKAYLDHLRHLLARPAELPLPLPDLPAPPKPKPASDCRNATGRRNPGKAE